MDVSHTLQPNTDQLNADDMFAAPIDVEIVAVHLHDDVKRPMSIEVRGRKPWWPCKGMRRIMAAVWGLDSASWAGQRARLYREPTVRYGGEEVGGIEISHMTGLGAARKFMVTISNRKKRPKTVQPYEGRPRQAPTDELTLEAVLDAAGLTMADLDRWAKSTGKPLASDLGDEAKRLTARWFAADTSRLDAVRGVKR